MRLNHNMFSLGIYRRYSRSLAEAAQSLNNISSGKKVSSAKDNPNRIASIDDLDLQIKARDAVSQNIQDTNSMLQTYDGALQEINNNLSRLKELTVKASNGTYANDDLNIIQKEVDSIKKSISDLCQKTTFNGQKLTSDNALADMNNPDRRQATIGELPGDKTDIPFYNLENIMDISSIDVNINASAAIDTVDNAIVNVTKIRSKYGALQSRLEDSMQTSDEISEVYTRAQSSYQDADIAEEMMNYTKNQVLIQASLGLMAQSNKLPQDSLNILANVR